MAAVLITRSARDEEKVRRADYVIRTDGTFDETEDQVRAIAETCR